MKKLSILFIVFLILNASAFPQIVTEQTQEPIFFDVKSHDPTLKELPAKSFYESKLDWQFIIDTTWGPGLPLAQKQQIFNAYIAQLDAKFDGFESLGFTPAAWDTFKTYYFNKINSNTSRGRFSAIMYYFASNLSDGHTYAFDKGVVYTALNPGIPVLVLGGFSSIEHFGAVLTVLEDSTALVLRVVDNHPLNLEPGDIILGYEGVLWKDLVQELLEAELPAFGGTETWWFGGTTGSQSSYNSAIHISVGMNWHLFDTIDILKFSTGDTAHLPVAPLLQLNLPPMLNNEQLEIPNIPFPDYFNNESVSYGILPNTNIGYINVISESKPTYAGADQQFNSAALALKDVDALIIDMRWNEGGRALWQDAFGYWTNEIVYTLEWAKRCSPGNFMLCPDGDTLLARLAGSAPDIYDRPIAVLVGPTCISNGDINAYRLKYLSTVRVFGKPTVASMGYSDRILSFADWMLRYSKADIFHINSPNNYLNRKELPLDYPVWFTPTDVANGNDTVVEEALEWINNLVYGHNVITDQQYYFPGNDTANISAIVENPNSHNAAVKIFIKDLDNSLIDSLELSETESGDIWQGEWLAANYEDIFKLDIETTDLTTGESFALENVNRVTTAGPIVMDSLEISYFPSTDIYHVKPHIKNEGQTLTLEDLVINMFSDDSTITSITGNLFVNSIAPGEIIIHPSQFYVKVDTNFSGDFTFNFEITKDGWLYWEDTYPDIISSYVYNELDLPVNYSLYQNYPNPFNPSTTIKYGIPERSFVELRIYDILGKEVKLLVNEEQDAGYYELNFNASDLSSGVYFYQLKAGSVFKTKKMILMK